MKITAYIITCPKLAPIRLPRLLKSINKLKDDGVIDRIKLIDGEDKKYSEYSANNYMPNNWNNHIKLGAPYFAYNMISVKSYEQEFPKIYSNMLENLKEYFPPRRLTGVEHSISNRHYFALEQISHADGLGIVFEDDVIINERSMNTKKLLSSMAEITKPYYFDLCDKTIPIPRLGKEIVFAEHKARRLKHAFIRTLQTYALRKETAKMLLDAYMGYSLPADMHLQIVADRIKIPGLSIEDSSFLHGSKIGVFSSSTDIN